MKKLVVFGIIIIAALSVFRLSAQTLKSSIDDICISPAELKLYNDINSYRNLYKLKPIPLSRSLTFVAQTHVKDLVLSKFEPGHCNIHTWSGKGKWTPCCYTGDDRSAKCMWEKPRELTKYIGDGFEIAFFQTGGYENSNDLVTNALSLMEKEPRA